ncbi:MAG: TIGR03118 family protein [Silvibacterium sp.]
MGNVPCYGKPWWVSNNGKGLALLYNGAGSKQGLIVTIPARASGKQGTPTGTIFNGSSTDFLLAPGAPALFLFATLDGTIAGWNPAVGLTSGMKPPSTHAVIAAKGASGSMYTGLTSARILANRYLYAANFGKGTVDVYDSSFHPVHFTVGPDEEEPFTDDRLPPDFVPFNVQAIGNDIVVTYALHEPGSPVETDGPGLGYVDVYSSMGRLELPLDHGDWLNAPWGVALAPLDFGAFSHELLIGQFAGGGTTESSGWVVAYSLATGHYQGRLEDTAGAPLSINGIWALSTGNSGAGTSNYDAAGSPASEVYFTAGPKQSSEGLFGYLTPISKELIQGNNQ